MNPEQSIRFASGALMLAGRIGGPPDANRGVVVAHPHPLYGGEMRNPVVSAVVQAYARRGWRTLRFNFRGVGPSQGTHDAGRGEIEDLLAAADVLHQQGAEVVDLAGYSFGAWIVARAPQQPYFGARMLVAPPVTMLDFSAASPMPHLRLVVSGMQDEFAPPDQLAAQLPEWNPAARLELLSATDHFFLGSLEKLETLLESQLKTA